MRSIRIAALAAGALALWLGPARPLDAAVRQQGADRDRPAARTPASDPIDAALERTIKGTAPLDDVKIETQWRRKTGMIATRIYGDGVGIWRDTTQFQLSREQFLDLLRAFEHARFGAMPKQYGSDEEGEDENEDKDRDKEKSRTKEKTYFQAIVGLRLGIQQKRVAQSMTGEQSKVFLELAQRIVAVSEKAAKTGIGATSLGDGLSRLAAGKLAPEALQLLVRRRTDRPGPGSEDGTWTLRLDGRRAEDASTADDKSVTRRLLVLSADDFKRLAAVLAENDPSGMPRNLYAPQYLTLDLRVLKESRDISARRYAGTTAQTHGAQQAGFDRIYAALLALHQRAVKEGTVLPPGAE